MYIISPSYGCVSCSDNYKAMILDFEFNACTESQYSFKSSFPDDSSFITHCINYGKSGNELECRTCDERYVLSTNKKLCLQNTNLNFCVEASTDSKCRVCEDDYVNVEDKCVLKSILKCLQYKENSATIACSKCENGFFLASETKCQTGDVADCLEYGADANECLKCSSGSTLITDANNNKLCFINEQTLNCKSFNNISFLDHEYICEECIVDERDVENSEKKYYFLDELE